MPSQFERLKTKAIKLKNSSNVFGAIESFEQYVKVYPNDPEALMNLGELKMQIEDFSAAAKIYAHLAQLSPNKSIYFANLGGALLRLGSISDAKTVLERAIELDPTSVFPRINLGGVLQAQEDFQGALKNALDAVALAPTHPMAFNNLGSAFSDLDLYAEAKHAYQTSLILDDKQVDALVNLGVVESRIGEYQNATSYYERAIELLSSEQGGRADAIRFFCCFCYFYLDQWEKAWDYYELGFSPLIPTGGARAPRRVFTVPRWDGSARPGKTLLVWREQGVGDEIIFSSVFTDLRSSGMKVILECDPRLVTLWSRSFPDFLVRPAAFNSGSMTSVYSDFDFHLPVCSLGAYFRRNKASFQNVNCYLTPDPCIQRKMASRIGHLAGDKPKVGILWRSIKLIPTRNRGYTLPSSWEGVLDRKDLAFFSLQYGLMRGEVEDAEARFGTSIHVLEDIDLKDDFDSVAAFLSQLDFVIAPNTMMFELAGALGIPTICMMVHPMGYYGFKDRFPYFPSVRILHTDNYFEDATDLLKKLPAAVDEMVHELFRGQGGGSKSSET